MCVQSKNNDSMNRNFGSSKSENWWEESVVQYGFNFPSVGVNLDRLMGTNVVRMTDPLFMLELRDRVWSDFDANLTKRIKERERIEKEREARLILKGCYNLYNRPQKFIPLHSRVLALDLGCHKNKTKNSIYESAEKIGPIFKINEQTNATINARRLKSNSNRQKDVDHVVRQTKLEGLEPNIKYDGLTAIETKIKEIQNKLADKKLKKPKPKPKNR